MKNLLHNLLVGAALVISSVAFAQEQDLAKVYLVGTPSSNSGNWVEPSAANAEYYANYALTETVAGSGIYRGKFTIAAGEVIFRIFKSLNGWDSEQYGTQAYDNPIECTFTDGLCEKQLTSGKGSLKFTNWAEGTMDITFDYYSKKIKVIDADVYTPTKPTLYITGSFDNFALNQEMTATEANNEVTYTHSLTDNFTGTFKIATTGWAVAYGNYTGVTFQSGVPVVAYASPGTGENNMSFSVENATNIVVTLVLDATDYYNPKTITLTWTDPASGIEDVATDVFEGKAVYYNLNGTRVSASDLSAGIYIKVVGNKATKLTIK